MENPSSETNDLKLEAVVLEYSRLWIRDEEILIHKVVEGLAFNDGTAFGIAAGVVTLEEAKAAYGKLKSNEFLSRVTPHIASQIVRERAAWQGKADICVDDVIDLFIFSPSGLEVWKEWFRDWYVYWIEEDATRWFMRGVGDFSLETCCTAMHDNPQSYRCCQLGCRFELIGPWGTPDLFVMPSGWRLICNRRADGN